MEAWAKRAVPTTIFGGSDSKGGSNTVMEILGADSAFNLVDRMAARSKQ